LCLENNGSWYAVWIQTTEGTPDAVFTVRQIQEKCRNKGKKFCFAFVDVKKDLVCTVARKVVNKCRSGC